VTTNDPENPRKLLLCKCKVRTAAKVAPRSVTFGKVERDGAPVKKSVKISRGDGGPISPSLGARVPKGIDAAIREVTPGEEYWLDVTLDPRKAAGPVRSSLRYSTGVPESPESAIRVTATIPPRVQAVPRQFLVPRNRDADFESAVRLEWSGGSPGNILEARCADKNVEVRVEQEGAEQRIVLRVPQDHQPQRGARYITVKTDDPAAGTLNIPLRYSARHGSKGVRRHTPAATAKQAVRPPEAARRASSSGSKASTTAKPTRK